MNPANARPVETSANASTLHAVTRHPGNDFCVSHATLTVLQVDIQLLQKDLTSDAGAMSTNLTSFHQYDDTVSRTWQNRS